MPPGFAGRDAAIRVPHHSRPGPRLQVRPSGEWDVSGPATDEGRRVFDLYLPLLRRTELVIGQLGQSLDGRIATESGDSRYVTGPADRRRLHRLRALVDAVVVGAGTVAADDPRLTVREVEGESPVRVVLDPDGRLDPDRTLFTDGAAPTLLVRATSATEQRRSDGVEPLTLPVAGPHGFGPEALVRALRDRGLNRILVEGGGITVSRFLRAGALDRLHVTVAPLLVGSGRPGVTLEPVDTLAEALRPPCRHFHLGDDVLFDLELR